MPDVPDVPDVPLAPLVPEEPAIPDVPDVVAGTILCLTSPVKGSYVNTSLKGVTSF